MDAATVALAPPAATRSPAAPNRGCHMTMPPRYRLPPWRSDTAAPSPHSTEPPTEVEGSVSRQIRPEAAWAPWAEPAELPEALRAERAVPSEEWTEQPAERRERPGTTALRAERSPAGQAEPEARSRAERAERIPEAREGRSPAEGHRIPEERRSRGRPPGAAARERRPRQWSQRGSCSLPTEQERCSGSSATCRRR